MKEADRPNPIVDPALGRVPGIAHGFFTREGGVSSGLYASLNCGINSGDEREAVLTNRARVATALGVSPDRLISPHQVHGATVAVASEPWAPGDGPEADAIVTKERGLAIGVGTADCAPVLFSDPAAGIVGAAHAGWGGAFKGVLEATIAAMVTLGAKPDRIVASVGPAIAQSNYETGPEFRARFIADDTENERFFKPSDKARHHLFDLTGYVAHRLAGLGLDRYDVVPADTYGDEARFFSFRRTTHRGDSDYGRMISAIVLT